MNKQPQRQTTTQSNSTPKQAIPADMQTKSVPPQVELELEVGFSSLLNQANLQVSAFAQHHVINAQVAEVVTEQDLLEWGFTPAQCARFFKHLKMWQKMRGQIVKQSLWDELKDQLNSVGVCSCDQLAAALGSDKVQCSNKKLLLTILTGELCDD